MRFALIVLAALTILPLSAQELRFPTNEDLRHTRALSGPRLSPNGESVLLQVTDTTGDGGRSHLWLVDVKQNTARQITFSPAADKRGEHNGEWMPDGGSMLFLARRGEHTQLYWLPLNGGEAQSYDLKIVPTVDESRRPNAVPPDSAKSASSPAVELDIANYFISPDGKTIAVMARDPQTPGEKKQHDEKADAVHLDHDQHGMRLYLLDAATDRLTVTGVPADVKSAAWGRQGQLAVATEAPNDAGDLAPAGSTWLVDLHSPEHPRQLTQVPSTAEGKRAWSEDGSRYYFMAQSKADAPPGYHDVYLLTLADGSVSDLSAGFTGSPDHQPLIAEKDAVLASVQTGVRLGYARFEPAKTMPLQFDTATVTELETNAKQSGWVWLGSDSTHPQTLFFAGRLGEKGMPLNAPATTPAAWTPVPSQLLHWTNEGQTIDGLLYVPPEAKQHKVPLIVDVHGGPTGAFEDSYSPLIEFLAGHGWAVLRPNPRGSTGYGAAFAAANKNDLGGADYRDIMAGVDAAIAAYPVDPQKLGLMGYSYGGEMAAFVEGKTDRFKGIVSGAPVIDQESEYGTEDSSWYDRWFYGGRPWEHSADAWRQSPLASAAKAKTPFLLLQGQADKTDPPGQSEEMYRALRQMGVPVDLVEYPREDHGPLAGGIFGNPSQEPWHGFDGRQRIAEFFTKVFAK